MGSLRIWGGPRVFGMGEVSKVSRGSLRTGEVPKGWPCMDQGGCVELYKAQERMGGLKGR